jgi:hypothetical protein
VVPGNHSWLLADPDAFGEVMTNVIEVARLAREMENEPVRGGLVSRLRPGSSGPIKARRLRSLSRARPGDEQPDPA